MHGYIDFVAVGNQGMNFASKNDEKYLGSVANAVLIPAFVILLPSIWSVKNKIVF